MTFFVLENSDNSCEITNSITNYNNKRIITFCTFDEAYYYIERKNVEELEDVYIPVSVRTLPVNNGYKWTVQVGDTVITSDELHESENYSVIAAIGHITQKLANKVLEIHVSDEYVWKLYEQKHFIFDDIIRGGNNIVLG